jgi:2,4-dienoyl-CoA reductase-like NADH-dependent reductase (Old Yellow Enzyme family)
MSDGDIADAIGVFGRATGDVKRLGFDMCEIHGAHGYLYRPVFWGWDKQA